MFRYQDLCSSNGFCAQNSLKTCSSERFFSFSATKIQCCWQFVGKGNFLGLNTSLFRMFITLSGANDDFLALSWRYNCTHYRRRGGYTSIHLQFAQWQPINIQFNEIAFTFANRKSPSHLNHFRPLNLIAKLHPQPLTTSFSYFSLLCDRKPLTWPSIIF